MIRLAGLGGEVRSVVGYAGFAIRRLRCRLRTRRLRGAMRDFTIASFETRSNKRSPQESQRQCGIAGERRALRGSGLGHGSQTQ